MRITVNGQSREIDDQTTISDLLSELGLSAATVAVEVNLDLVPRAQHAARVLAPGDTLEVVSLVGGG